MEKGASWRFPWDVPTSRQFTSSGYVVKVELSLTIHFAICIMRENKERGRRLITQEYVLDEPTEEWLENPLPEPTPKGGFSLNKTLSEGLNGRPQAYLQTLPEAYKNRAHFHDEAQFQVVLEGNVEFPGHRLEAIAVHYSDPNTAYGPFVAGPGFKFAVLRPRLAKGKGYMDDPKTRDGRNPYGREIFGISSEHHWRKSDDLPATVQSKVLFGGEGKEGPAAQLWNCSPNSPMPGRAAPFGEYQILVEGSGQVEGKNVKPHFMRYTVGDTPPAPVTAGPEGATWLILTFDQAARPTK